MNIFKSKIGLKITVFATILLVMFWMIPSGMVFGEGEEGGAPVETTAPETTAPETTAPETTAPETTAPETTAPETTAPDTTAPVITLLGDAQVNINVGDAYTDAGATASDDVDGDITANIVAGGAVDTSAAGSYELTYNVSDAAGNAAAVTRNVNVAELPDTLPPIIDLNGNPVINLHIGNIFTDPGATATDNKDENVAVVATGTVDTNVIGSYTIRYNATDAAGNAASTVIRTVNVTSEATINTNKPDYLPNDYVLVTGSGWLPGETVRLDFTETLLDPILQQTITYYTVADSEGNISDIQYIIELRHLGASFILTATGQTSGLTAQTTFTDGTVTITITKEVYESDGVTRATGDTTPFTIRVWKNVSNIETRTLTDGGSYTFSNNAGLAGALYSVTEDSSLGYTTVLPSSQWKISGAVSFVVKNIKAAPTTITIKKEVYEPDGTTIDADNADTFTVELWTANLVGGPDTLKSTVTLIGNQTSAPIPVAPNVAYVVKETTIDPDYSISYNPASGILYPAVSGTLTPSAGSSDKIFTVKNTHQGNTFTVTKTGLKSNNDLSDFFYDRAKFTLHNPSGAIVKTSTGADSITLDNSDSILSIYSDTYTWDKLPDGTGYKLVESYDVSPANRYTYNSSLPGNEYTFNISGDNASVTVNNAAVGSIRAYKQDNYGTAFAGAEIGLYANEGDIQPLQSVFSSAISPDPNVLFTNVASGGPAGITYYIHEINSLPGYAPDTGWYPVTINDTDLNPVLGTTIVNTPSGVITLHKVDNNRNPLGGAVFGLYLVQDAATAPLTTATSDSAGLVTFEHLGYKTYYIRETGAPFGFLLDENWYEVTLTPENTPYDIETPIVDIPGGTITVSKNVIAPDGRTDVADAKEFTITLEKKDELGNWVAVKSATIKEGTPKVFSVPLDICYRVVETADAKYTEIGTAGEVTLSVPGQNQDLLITNRQHYAVIIMGKIIYEWNSFLPTLITDDDHIFFTKLEGGHPSLIEWHPIATKLPTVFLVWPGTYTVFERPDVNYNDNGQPVIISGFDISDLNLADMGDLSGLAGILLTNILGGGGLSQEITVEGGDIKPLIIANKYTPQYGTVTVTKDVVGPGLGETADGKEFSVKLQRLSLSLPDILGALNLSNLGNISNLSDLMGILDVTQLGSLSDLLGWEDAGTPSPQNVSEGNPVTFNGVEKDHIYRVVETQEPGYLQIHGILPFYFEPEVENKTIDIVNKQELVFVRVSKDVLGADGLPVEDCNLFWVKLDGGTTPTFPQMIINEEVDALFAVMPGTYTLTECPQACYDRVDTIGTITLNPGDGPLCDPIELTVINKQKPGTITITKNGLMGNDSAVFTLCDKDGNVITGVNQITLAQGQSGSWTGLNWGCYTIREDTPPCGNLYTYSTVTYSPSGPISIGCNACSTGDLTKSVIATNSGAQIKTAKIKINKTVIGTKLATDEFRFTVFDGTNSQNVVIGGNGGDSAEITVEAGKSYVVEETFIGNCFESSGCSSDIPGSNAMPGVPGVTLPKVTFTVTGCNVSDIDGKKVFFENTRKRCEVTIKKLIDGTDATEGIFDFSFVTGPGSFSLPVGSNYYKTIPTIECGIEYTITEDSLSAGFELADITSGGVFSVFSKDIPNKSVTFAVACNSIASQSVAANVVGVVPDHVINFDNHKIPGTVTLQKTDAVNGAALNGARFGLFMPDGTTKALDVNGVEVPEVITGDGAWADGYAEFANIPWGSYRVIEITPPAGYLPVDVAVTIDGSHLTIPLTSAIADPRIPGFISLDKTDAVNGAALNGARFGLFMPDGTTKALDVNGVEVPEVITGDGAWVDGYAEFANIPWGSYRVIEIAPPAGYLPVDVPVTIDASHLTVPLTSAIADPRIPGFVSLNKTDAVNGAALNGARFGLFMPDGTTKALDVNGVEVPEVVTGDGAWADGYAEFANIPWGSYMVIEITPPAGYYPMSAAIVIDGSNLTISLTSEIADPRIPGFITLTKTDSVTGLPVAGAEYWVYNSGGTHIETLITGPDGSVTVSGFVWGTYSIKEISAPAGYLVDPATYSVTIGANSTRVFITVQDIPAGGGGTTTITVAGLTEGGGIQVLAFTGIDPIIPLAGGSAVIAGLAILLASLRRRVSKQLVRSTDKD